MCPYNNTQLKKSDAQTYVCTKYVCTYVFHTIELCSSAEVQTVLIT